MYDHDHVASGFRESRVFRIRPRGEFRPKEAVNFDIVMCQSNKEEHKVKLQVHVIPEVVSCLFEEKRKIKERPCTH